jgi:hypothetical protein
VSSSRLILAVDPGVVTGLVVWDTFNAPEAMELPENDAMDLVADTLTARAALARSKNTLVVCEDFVPRGGALTWFPESLHQIGWLKHHCRRSYVQYRLQTARDAKTFSTDSKLKRIGGIRSWYHLSMDAYRPDLTSHPQAIDAMRHLMLAAVKIGIISAEDLI